MARKILFTSLKGGTGVTSCCIGIGLSLAKAGGRVLVLDGDTKCGGALAFCGLLNMHVYTLADYEKGACRAKQTIVTHPKNSNLCFIPAIGLENPEYFSKAVKDLDGLFDFILLDKVYSSPLDEAVIVTEPYIPSLKCADVCRSMLADSGVKEAGLIICKMSGAQILSGEVLPAAQIASILHLPLIGVIPEDLTISSGKCREATLNAYALAAEFIAGGKKNIFDVTRPYLGLNGYFKRKMRQKI